MRRNIDAVNKGLEEEKGICRGSRDLKFRELVKNKIDFAIVSSEVLPGSKTAEDAKEKDRDTDSKKNSDSKDQKKADIKDTDDKSADTDSKKTADSSDENEEGGSAGSAGRQFCNPWYSYADRPICRRRV